MATIRQYFETDFNYAARMHVRVPFRDLSLEAALLYDFSGYSAFLAYYIAGKDCDLDFFIELIRSIKYGRTQLQFDGE